MAGDENMAKLLHFKTFIALSILCFAATFLLFVNSPSGHQDLHVVENAQLNHRSLPVALGSKSVVGSDKLSDPWVKYVKDQENSDRPLYGMEDFEDKVNETKVFERIGQGVFNISSWVLDRRIKNKAESGVGLTFHNREFFLSKKPFRIFSGSVHYFRLLPQQWRDRLLKLKACGLNTVETYVPWNLHEPKQGLYNFKGNLDLRAFLLLARELGLYVILRPGPYICSEIDFGGLPGWLLKDEGMKVRSNYGPYLKAVTSYFETLLPKVVDMQYTLGGPIIMVQVENEYAVYGKDIKHLKVLTYLLRHAGINEMLVTSDNTFANENLYFDKYALPTANGARFNEKHYKAIMGMNPHFPFMIMELWTGWFDSWGQDHHSLRPTEDVVHTINKTLQVGASFNLYMFHGGTNFGFLSGAINITKYAPFVTSYDYDALLTEAGDITPKYTAVRELLAGFYKTIGFPKLPNVPPNSPKKAYGRLNFNHVHINWTSLFNLVPISHRDTTPDFMESYVNNNGRLDCTTMGYILYSHQVSFPYSRTLPGVQINGFVRDRMLSIMNGVQFSILNSTSDIDEFLDYPLDKLFTTDHYEYYDGFAAVYDQVFSRPHWHQAFVEELKRVMAHDKERKRYSYRLDLLVENQGRTSYSPRRLDLFSKQRKGMSGPVFRFFGDTMDKWMIKFLTFSREQTERFSYSGTWSQETNIYTGDGKLIAPTLFRAFLRVEGEPADTFINLEGWTKGLVVVNNFLLGRYMEIGPQNSLYLPSPLLKTGTNEIMIFEEEQAAPYITFQSEPSLGPPQS